MKTYINKPGNIKGFNDLFSLTPSDYKKINYANNNIFSIGELIDYENVGEQIDVINYLEFDTEYKLGTISGMKGIIFDEYSGGENISPYLYNKSFKKLSKGEIIISRNATLGKASYINNNIKCILNGGLTNIYIKDLVKRFYIFGFFFSSIPSEYLKLITSGGGTQQNAKRQNVLDIKIPFPTKNNNENPEKIEKLFSLIVQNIISKEEQIKSKSDIIDNNIEKELRENQIESAQVFKFPRISEIKEVGRLDTGLFKKDFKKLYNLIFNYNNNYFYLEKKELSGGNTPKKRIFEPTNKEYLWFTPTDINSGLLGAKKYIKAEKYNLGEDYCLLFSNRSNCGEGILYSPEFYNGGHHNQGIYRKKFKKEDFVKNIFILTLYNSSLYKNLISDIATGATFPELRIDQFLNIPLPNFTNLKQEEISKEYYNKKDKNNGLDFENYLEKEKTRNNELGIFQLNMEIFSLREVLEDLVDKIVMDKKIEIDFNY